MQIKVLCVGDVVGTPGRRALQKGIKEITRTHSIECVVVNAENVAGGSGITQPIYEKVLSYGVDLITLGDHIYGRREAISLLETTDRIVRPSNLPPGAPGKEIAICHTNSGHRIAVLSVLGRLYMKTVFDCPYRSIDRILLALPRDVRLVLVDMHGEATSEKVAMGWYLDGRVSVVFGTHTHIQTADECVLPKGTAYITDLGMTGPYDSVLGRDKNRVLSAMISGVPNKFDVATKDARMSGVVVTLDTNTGKAVDIERIQYKIPDA